MDSKILDLGSEFDHRKIYFEGKLMTVKDLPSAYRRGIKQAYFFGFYCKECFDKGKISLLIRAQEIFNVCPQCGVEISFEEEVKMKKYQYKRKKSKYLMQI